MPDINYYKVGGSLEYQHPTYVVRQADAQLYQGLINGEFCYVLNSRQMGKSSLRVQMTKRLKAQGVKCAAIDMTRIGSHVTPEEWYGGLVSELLRGFRLSRKINFSNWWRDRSVLSPVQRLSEFIDDVLLIELSDNIVIFIDEIDSIIKIPFRDDFFAFIRACYNQRVDNPNYQRLTFCLLGVATPSDLIADRTLSTPFNIGTAIELTGFNLDEVNPLVQGLEPIVSYPNQVIAEVLEWTGGQPFLTQKLCKLIVQESESDPFKSANQIEALVRENIIENWEACDEPEHLRTIRDRIKWSQRRKPLLFLYQKILQQGDVKAKDTPEQMELRLSGLVVKQPGKLKVANRIYQAVFNKNWVNELLAEAGALVEMTPATPLNSEGEIEDIEEITRLALQELESRQIEALLLALQAGYKLKNRINQHWSLSDYPTLTPLFALQKILNTIREHNRFTTGQRMVQDVCFNPDGESLVTAGGDGTIKLWNRFGQLLREWQGHQGIIYDISFSANGQFVATAGRDGMAKVWHISGEQITQVSGHNGSISSINFNPDGDQLITVGRDGTAKLWNLFGKAIAQLKSRGGVIWSATFSPNGQQIATAGTAKFGGTVILWDASGKNIITQFHRPYSPILSISFSPDGKSIGTADHAGKVILWNLLGEPLAHFNNHHKTICFSPNGKYFATVSGGIARVCNLSGELLALLNNHLGAVLGLSFSPDSQRLATAGVDGNVRFWDLSPKHPTRWNTDHGIVYVASFTPNQKYIFTVGADCKICLWNLKGKQLAQLDDPRGWIRNASFSPGMHYIVTAGADGKVRLWRVTWQLSNSDQKSILTLSDSDTLRWQIKNLADEELGHCDYQTTFWYEFPHSTWVNSVSCSLNWQNVETQRIATAGADGMVCIWGLSGNVLTQWNTNRGELKSISFHPDGQRIVTAGVDGTVCLWDLSGNHLGEWNAHQGETTSVSCSPDGQIIATAATDGTAKLWTISGQLLAEFKGDQGAIRTVSFCASGKLIATAGDDGTVRLWQVEGLEELLARGYDWLKDYFVTHPEAVKTLKSRSNSIAAESNPTPVNNNEGISKETHLNPMTSSLPFTPGESDNLTSECQIDYTHLRDLLATGQWQEADSETTAIMLNIAGRGAKDWLRAEDVKRLPGTDLLTIDQLWVKYSQGRFGFSVQKQIWESVGGTEEEANFTIYRNFSKSVGWDDGSNSWLYYSDLNFSMTAPMGHLPGGLLDWLWSSYRESRLILAENPDSVTDSVWWTILPALASKFSERSKNTTQEIINDSVGIASDSIDRTIAPKPLPTTATPNLLNSERKTDSTGDLSAASTASKPPLVKIITNKPGEGFISDFLVDNKLVRIYQGDITNLAADVIVSSDDTYLSMGGGVSRRIRRMGGNIIDSEARNFRMSNTLSIGDVAVTSAGKLQAKKVFHGAVIDWQLELFPSQKIIQKVVHDCLRKANDYGYKTIVFPLLGTGAGCLDKQTAWEIMLKQIIMDLLTTNQTILEVCITLYDRETAVELNPEYFLSKVQNKWLSR